MYSPLFRGVLWLRDKGERTKPMPKVEPQKLPGKKTPPTLILKRAKNGSTELGPIPPPAPEAKIPKK